MRHSCRRCRNWVGQSAAIDYRWGLGTADFYRRQAADLVSLAPDVILTNGTSTIGPVLQTTHTVPIVFVNVSDPVAGGFVESLARPGGSATGFASAEWGMSGKWLELLKQIAPHVKHAAAIRNPRVASGSGQYGAIQAVAPFLGMETSAIDARDAGEIERGIAALVSSSNADCNSEWSDVGSSRFDHRPCGTVQATRGLLATRLRYEWRLDFLWR
jgi:putative tryptophan/tyrosine transport system substrate-binding protein